MGQIFKNSGSDYSKNNVGRFDFVTGVYRKKISDGVYERNVLKQQNSYLYSVDEISIPDRVKITVDWLPKEADRSGVLFSIADRNSGRVILIRGYYSNRLQVYMFNGNGSITENGVYRQKNYAISPQYDVHNIITVVFNFGTNEIEYVENSEVTLPEPTEERNDNIASPFDDGIDILTTACIGQNAANHTVSTDRGFSSISSVLVQDMVSKSCVLLMDFMGDTYIDKISEKSHDYQFIQLGTYNLTEDNVSV